MGIGILLVVVLVIGLAMSAAGTESLQGALVGLLGFIESYAVPFILGLAFVIFVWNAIRFFVIGGDSDEGRENAKNLALYSIGAFIFILSFWGIVNILAAGVGLKDCGNNIVPDYLSDDYRNNPPCTTPTPEAADPGPRDTEPRDPITIPIPV
jgi:Type IV secretion system pilin